MASSSPTPSTPSIRASTVPPSSITKIHGSDGNPNSVSDAGVAAACAVAAAEGASLNVRINLGGIAKGSGMIHPDMATMLAVVTTDAALPEGMAETWLREAVDASFHRISVDGDTSTNDSIYALASGAATSRPIAIEAASGRRFSRALTEVLE